ncbi:MAG: phytoene desaturase family protein [Lutibacter sp.]|nr:phytoene desaturase family protein [Lutibacter sp.]
MKKKIIIIGSGFSSLSASCYLAKAGYEVTILEKNSSVGGRARLLTKDGFKFDIGPTWYWMPDVFEKFFKDFNKKPSDFYDLEKLAPAYQVYFDQLDSLLISDKIEEIYEVFENEEKGSSIYLKKFLKAAKFNYEVAVNNLVYKPGNSITELVTFQTIANVNQFFKSISTEVRGHIKSEKLIQILEFPVLFLGAKPSNTPSFYSFMNYADFGLGTWHPKGGMYEVVKGFVTLAEELGVNIETNQNVEKIVVENRIVKGVQVNNQFLAADFVVSGADYHHSEILLDEKYRMYSEKYWDKRTFAPSALLFYVGFSKKLKNVSHHTLFFDSNFDKHAVEIYDRPQWPKDPLFYGSFPSITDDSFAPKGYEAATFLIPIAPGIIDIPEIREEYFQKIIDRLEMLTNQNINDFIILKESYCVNDFVNDYNSFKGNAYGLANTLMQTAFLRPKIQSKKVKNLFFTGQLTVPGPGVPPAIISGKIVSELLMKNNI